MDLVIGIGEFVVSNDLVDKIKTYALASCVAMTAYCSTKKTGGMVHIALPFPGGHSEEYSPGYYASTGIPLLLDKLFKEYGCKKSDIKVQLYGGANSIHEKDVFNIGKRNLETVTKLLSEMGIRIEAAEVGGTVSRTIEMDIATGEVKISTQPINI